MKSGTVSNARAYSELLPFRLALARCALDRVRSLAHDYARRAKACLNGSDSEYARALLTVPDFILEREN